MTGVPGPVTVKSVASTLLTFSLNVTRKVTVPVGVVVGDVAGVNRAMLLTTGAVLSLKETINNPAPPTPPVRWAFGPLSQPPLPPDPGKFPDAPLPIVLRPKAPVAPPPVPPAPAATPTPAVPALLPFPEGPIPAPPPPPPEPSGVPGLPVGDASAPAPP